MAENKGGKGKEQRGQTTEEEKEDLVSPLTARREKGGGGGAVLQAANRAGMRERIEKPLAK